MSLVIVGCGKNQAKEAVGNENLLAEEASPTPVKEEEIIILEEINEPELKQDIADQYDLPDVAPHALQIVFLGESNLDAHRNETGISYIVGQKCDATVYNLSISGTTAALNMQDESGDREKNKARSLVGVSEVLAGKANIDNIGDVRAAGIMEGLNVEKTDYFVIMYGAQDFLQGIPLDAPEYDGGPDTYVGALKKAIANLREAAPHADFVLCAPHYAQFFDEDNVFLGDGNILSNGHGFLFDYKGKIEHVANDQNGIFLNAFQDLGIDGNTVGEFLEDGVHLSEAGRRVYAERIAKMILDHEMNHYN